MLGIISLCVVVVTSIIIIIAVVIVLRRRRRVASVEAAVGTPKAEKPSADPSNRCVCTFFQVVGKQTTDKVENLETD